MGCRGLLPMCKAAMEIGVTEKTRFTFRPERQDDIGIGVQSIGLDTEPTDGRIQRRQSALLQLPLSLAQAA